MSGKPVWQALKTWLWVALSSLLFGQNIAHAVVFEIRVLDSPNEGYNSTAAPDPVSTAAGNTGASLGEQRLIALRNALQWWGARLDSVVPVVVNAEMEGLTCDSDSGILAAAGPVQVFGWTNNPPSGAVINTWYHSALFNRLLGSDASPGHTPDDSDILTIANSAIDNNDACLFRTNWFYGLGAAPPGTISFFATMLHELGHGLGVSSFTSTATGEFLSGFPGIYESHLHDANTSPFSWLNMTALQRLASMTDTGNLRWNGTHVNAQLAVLKPDPSGDNDQPRLYAPAALRSGSSVSHWDTVLSSSITDSTGQPYDELMEPFATGKELVMLSDEMLQDMGWNAFEGDCLSPMSTANDIVTLRNTTVASDREACLDLFTAGDTTVAGPGDVTFSAGRRIDLGAGFKVAHGAAFRAEIDPLKTLRR